MCGTLGVSEQEHTYELSNSTGTSIQTVRFLPNDYEYDLDAGDVRFVPEIYESMLSYRISPDGTIVPGFQQYAIASRCVSAYDKTRLCFSVRWFTGDRVTSRPVWYSNGSWDPEGGDRSQQTFTSYLKPMVTIPLSAVTVGQTGDGTMTSPYSITAK